MRRTLGTAAMAWCFGFCMAAASAYGYAQLDAWRGFGENFQLGYVVGFLDATSLQRRHDVRALIPSMNKPNYERWRLLVNEYFADPANAQRPVPDGMAAAGKIFQKEMFVRLNAEREARQHPSPSPSPAPGLTPTPAN